MGWNPGVCSAGNITGEMGCPVEGYLNPWFPLLLLLAALLIQINLRIHAHPQTHIHGQRDFWTRKHLGLHKLSIVTKEVHFLREENSPLGLMQRGLAGEPSRPVPPATDQHLNAPIYWVALDASPRLSLTDNT